jgi:hypothetical protein
MQTARSQTHPAEDVIFIGSTFGLLITLLSLFALSPGSSGRIVAFVNIPGLLFMMAWSGYVLWRFRFNSSLGLDTASTD